MLLPIPVKIELLSGVRTRNREALALGLEALPVAYPTDDTWRMLVTSRARWSGPLIQRSTECVS